MIESVAYWAKEYHLDGFRFDLMGLHDVETMNEISTVLHKIDPTIFIYGEGWTAGSTPLPEEQRAIKKNTLKLNKIAAFSDDIRDGLRGPFGNVHEKGFVSGGSTWKESVKFGIVASTKHPQINYSAVHYSNEPWANEPTQAMTYVSCHDDNTLYDRLKITNPGASEEAIIKMDKLSNAIVLTSQGVSFLHAGEEMLRTKQGIGNSYKSPDFINQLDWSRKKKYKAVFNYYKGLISLRKNHPAFRMSSTKMIQDHLQFFDTKDQVIGYHISGNANGDKWKNIAVLLNGSEQEKTVKIPRGNWVVVVDGDEVNEKGIKKISGSEVTLPATTAFVLYKM
jgi:pullulanase